MNINSVFFGIVSLSLCMAGPASCYPERDQFVRFQDYSQAKSEPTYDAVERGLSTIPKEIRQSLYENGYYVLVAPTMLSAKPGWEGAVPRGWDPESNYDNVGGLFESGTRRLVIPETVQSMTNSTKYIPNKRAELTTRHELGHAYDDFQGHVSRSDAFVDAYTADADRLHSEELSRFSYFLQPNGAGYSELFAELFAAAYTPDRSSNQRYEDLLKSFPKTTQLMLKLNPNVPKDTKKSTTPSATPTPESNQSSTTSSPTEALQDQAQTSAHTLTTTSDQQRLMSLHQQLVPLYASGNYSQAEPLMKQYVSMLEHTCCSTPSSAATMKQTYLSYADLLRRVHKPIEAQQIADKAKNVKSSQWNGTTTPGNPKLDAAAANAGYGVVGLKFVLARGRLPVINRIFQGLPAANAGLLPNDEIIMINGEQLDTDTTKEKIYDKIIGPPGTTVTVTVKRNQQQLTVKLKRVPLTDITDPIVKRDYLEQ